MTALVVLTVVGIGAGFWLVATGWQPLSGVVAVVPAPPPVPAAIAGPTLQDRAIRATLAAVVLLILSRWPTAAIAGALLGWFSPELFASRSGRDAALARTEAIASWTEMLRDTISAAHGLEAAITTTAPVAPEAIRPRSSTWLAP